MTETFLPPAPSRIDHLLDVARREFLAHGYHRVSVEGIARAASVSKQTIYRRFSDKGDILRAIVGQVSARFRSGLVVVPAEAGPVSAIVAACVAPIRADFISGESRSLFRLDISIAARFQDLSRALNDDFIASLAPIAAQLQALAERGALSIDSPMGAAAQLGSLAVEGSRYLMGFPPPARAQDGTEAIVDLYLNGFAGRSLARYGAAVDDAPPAPGLAALHRAIRPYFANADDLRLSEAELQNLVRVARRKFFAAGYREVSLEEIGVTAKVGRGTLYRWFGGKEALFRAAMLHAAAEIGAARISRPTAEPAESLAELAFTASGVLTGRIGTRLYRTMIAEADAFPDLAREVFTLSRAALMAAAIERLRPLGEGLPPADLAWAAMQFLTIASDGARYLSVDSRPDIAGRRALARRAAELFLHGRRAR